LNLSDEGAVGNWNALLEIAGVEVTTKMSLSNVNVNLYSANRKASNALCTLVKREKKFSKCPGENCKRNVTDLAGSLVKSSRRPGRPQTRPDDRTLNAGVVVRAADGSRRTADAGDEQCLGCGCSSPSCTVVLCAADIVGIRVNDKLAFEEFSLSVSVK